MTSRGTARRLLPSPTEDSISWDKVGAKERESGLINGEGWRGCWALVTRGLAGSSQVAIVGPKTEEPEGIQKKLSHIAIRKLSALARTSWEIVTIKMIHKAHIYVACFMWIIYVFLLWIYILCFLTEDWTSSVMKLLSIFRGHILNFAPLT